MNSETAPSHESKVEKGAIPKINRRGKNATCGREPELKFNIADDDPRRETIVDSNPSDDQVFAGQPRWRNISLNFPDQATREGTDTMFRKNVERIIRRNNDELHLQLETWMNEMKRSMEKIRVNLTPRKDKRQTFANEYASGRDRRRYIRRFPAADDTIGQGWLKGRYSVRLIRESSQ